MLVERNVPDARIGLDQGLGAVPVVDIPVDDEHSLPAASLCLARRHHDIVDQTEPHAAGPHGVMARGPNRGKGVAPTRHRVIQARQHGAGGSQHGAPASLVEYRVEEEHPASRFAHPLQTVEMLRRVHRQECLPGRGVGALDGKAGLLPQASEDRP